MPILKSIGITRIVVISALGYFVDLYDLLIFTAVRVKSFIALGVPDEDAKNETLNVTNWTVGGMVIGAILWGTIADKRGRLKVLFFSILLYTLASLFTGFVTDLTTYKLLRFLVGIGLAGELGSGITLTVETMSPAKRTLGTLWIAFVGMLGAVTAGIVGNYIQDWRWAYWIGAILGFGLLILRVSTIKESDIFLKSLKKEKVIRGSIWVLFTNFRLLAKFLKIVFIGWPVFFIVGILIALSKEFGQLFGIKEAINIGWATAICYFGIAIADIAGNLVSQKLRTRKKVLKFFIVLIGINILTFIYIPPATASGYYIRCFFLGASLGYWGLIVTLASESVGLNVRGLVTVSAPNFIRASFSITLFLFRFIVPLGGIINAAAITGIITVFVAFLCTIFSKETWGMNLDYFEEVKSK